MTSQAFYEYELIQLYCCHDNMHETFQRMLLCIPRDGNQFGDIEKGMIFDSFEMGIIQYNAECCKVSFVSRGFICPC